MIFEVKPFKGVGSVELGMTSEQVQAVLKEKPRTFKKNQFSEGLTDDFQNLGLHVHYDHEGNCEAIELFSPSVPIYQGQHLLDKSFGHLEQWLKSLDPKAKFENVGIKSNDVGIGIYAPFGEEEPSKPPEGVIVYKEGYYN
jgi:hypothetical protein